MFTVLKMEQSKAGLKICSLSSVMLMVRTPSLARRKFHQNPPSRILITLKLQNAHMTLPLEVTRVYTLLIVDSVPILPNAGPLFQISSPQQ